MPRAEIGFLVLAGIFLVSLVVANMVAAKLFVFSGVVLVVGLIPYPVTFLATDLMCEVYGQKRANAVVLLGFVLSLYVLLILKLGQAATPFEPLNVQHEYEVIFGNSARAIVASMVAYLVAQLIDVKLFHFWKRLTNGRHLWLRNNGSTVLSQMVDSILVVSILFADKMPFGQLVLTIVAGYVFKLIIALIDTPLFYFGARWFRVLVTPPGQREGHPGRRALASDSALAIGSLGGVVGLVGAAATWTAAVGDAPVVYGWGVTPGLIVLALSAAVIVSATVGLSERRRVRMGGSLLLVFGGLLSAVAWLYGTDFDGMGPAIAGVGGLIVAGAGAFAWGSGRDDE